MISICMNLVLSQSYLSFGLVYFECKHFLTLILPSCRLKQICKFLSSFRTMLLIAARVKLLNDIQDGLYQLKGLNMKAY